MPETRRIENFGVMKLLPEERGAVALRVLTDVIQLPYSEYLNVRSNPPKGHYGWACLMDGEYVLDMIDIQFRRQVLIDKDRLIVQLAWQEFCNSRTIAGEIGNLLLDTPVTYPIWNCKEIRFRLEPGVILNVFKTHIPPVVCLGTGISEPDLSGDAPGLPPSPTSPPPLSTPEKDKLPLASPYEGENDNGNTYVRDIPVVPPSAPSPQGDCNKVYAVSYSYTVKFAGFAESSSNGDQFVFGGFLGIFAKGGQIVLRSDRTACGKPIEETVVAQGPSEIESFSGTATLGAERT